MVYYHKAECQAKKKKRRNLVHYHQCQGYKIIGGWVKLPETDSKITCGVGQITGTGMPLFYEQELKHVHLPVSSVLLVPSSPSLLAIPPPPTLLSLCLCISSLFLCVPFSHCLPLRLPSLFPLSVSLYALNPTLTHRHSKRQTDRQTHTRFRGSKPQSVYTRASYGGIKLFLRASVVHPGDNSDPCSRAHPQEVVSAL